MNVILPLRAEFGLKVWWFVPAVNAVPGPKVVYIEPGEEALYPGANELITVERQRDELRRNRYARDAAFVAHHEELALARFGQQANLLRPDPKWPRARFIPKPVAGIADQFAPRPDVVVCPRKRDYGAEKNWPHWPQLVRHLDAHGAKVFAAGAPEIERGDPAVEAGGIYLRPQP